MAERKIRITAGSVSTEAKLDGSKTAQAIWDVLPLTAKAETWGEEIYFAIPVHLKEEIPKDVVEIGDLGYWPSGNGFCIFFGPTPASRGQEIRPASPVNVFGRIVGDAKVFKKVRSGATVSIERA